MIKYAISKFSPALFKKGRFLREDWTSCSDIGALTSGRVLSKEEYLRVEGLYLDAVTVLAKAVDPETVRAHNVEFWDNDSGILTALGLDDVFRGDQAPTEGESISGDRLANVVRRCLREVAWLELVTEPRLLIHLGYDMRLVVASAQPLSPALDEIRSIGLFAYDSYASLPTVDEWLK